MSQYKYLLVIDFEATCEAGIIIKNQEIIEFPCVLIDIKTKQIIDVFHQYVKPIHNPISQFCTELTGIVQTVVDSANTFDIVFHDFINWMKSHELYPDQPTNYIMVSCGDWDFAKMLPMQAKLSKITLPHCFYKWINIKQAYQNLTNVKIGGMPDLLNKCKLELVGKHHSGIDDTRNISRCAIYMLDKLNWLPEFTMHK